MSFTKLVRLYPSKKIDWDNIFLAMAYLMATGSHCSARKTASILVKNKAIISTGVNGTPDGAVNCDELFPPKSEMTPEQRLQHKEFQAYAEIHAEMNAINMAASSSTDITGSTLYTVCKPCHDCMKNILKAGITRIVYYEVQKNANGSSLNNKDGHEFHPVITETIDGRKMEIIQKNIDWEAFGLYQKNVAKQQNTKPLKFAKIRRWINTRFSGINWNQK